MKTFLPKEIDRKWHVIDAKGKVLGKIATKAADLLRGKHKAIFTTHIDCGDFVIVINAKHVALTGKKVEDKEYFRHSRYFGNLKTKTARQMLDKKPEDIVYLAVKGMLHDNKLRDCFLKRLKVFGDEKHDHEAQQPVAMEIK